MPRSCFRTWIGKPLGGHGLSKRKFARPLAQRRGRSVLFFVLVCYPLYPPVDPRHPFPAGLGAPRALPGRSWGAPWIRSRVLGAPGSIKGIPRTLQDRPREHLGPPQSSQGPPIEPPGCPGTNLALTKGPPGCPKYYSRAPLSWKY